MRVSSACQQKHLIIIIIIILPFILAIRRYGKDFTAIAEVIGTKTAAQVRLRFCAFV